MKDQLVFPKMKSLFEDPEFIEKLEEQIVKDLDGRKSCGIVNTNGHNGGNNRSTVNNGQQQSNGHRINNVNGQQQQGGNSVNIKKNNNTKNNSSMNNIVDISDDSPPTQVNNMPPNNRIQITSNGQHQNNSDTSGPISGTILSSDPYEVPNLSVRQVCLCGKSCQMMQPKKDYVFKCCHCNLYYHIECMQRGKNNVNQTDPIKKLVACAYCHLRQLGPLK